MTDDRIVIVPNTGTANNAVTTYIDTLVLELKRHFNVLEIPVDQSGVKRAVEMIRDGEGLAYLSVANVGQLFKLTDDKAQLRQLFESGRTSYIFADFDHPLLIGSHLLHLPKGAIYTNPSLAALECVKPFLREGTQTALLAHGADCCEALDWEKRDIECVFPGNLNKTPDDVLAGWQRLQSDFRVKLKQMVKVYAENENGPPLPLAEIARRVLGPVEEAPNLDVYLGLVTEFDSYARQRARFDLVRRIKRAPLTFIGRGWDAYPEPNRSFLGLKTAAETLDLMRRSRVVLNITASYFSSHERVFNGMIQRSAVGTFGKDFLSGLPGEDDDPIVYLTPDTIDDKLCELLADEDALRERAERGRKLAMEHHTWRHRADTIAKLIAESQNRLAE